MPRDSMVIEPRPGHVDTTGDFVVANVGVSVEYVTDTLSGQTIALLHLDVARGEDIDNPFSVGIPLTPFDVQRVVMSLNGAGAHQMLQVPGGERLN